MFQSTRIQIETERLLLQPLSYIQLIKYSFDIRELEIELQVNPSNIILPPELKNALENAIIPNSRKNSRHNLFCTLWIMIDRNENRLVGDFCFKGPPNESDEVEIGYGTFPEYMKKGFMTEAIQGISMWAFNETRITAILAETDRDNLASQKVLIKNNFIQFKEVENMLWWKLARPEVNNKEHR